MQHPRRFESSIITQKAICRTKSICNWKLSFGE
jgi:hypothetical protein